MKRFFKRAVCVLMVLIILLGNVESVSASTHGVRIINGVDYSGRGTVINGNIAINNTAKINGNYVKVPIYKGKYVAGSFNYWWTKSWSGWSTSNNKNNADFTVYNGSNKATEYDVQSRSEHQYKRKEKRDVYSTKYYTVYQGTKFYNKWITKTESSFGKYPGNKSGYKIVRRYTKRVKNGTTTVTVYDSTWRTSKPISFNGYPWEVYNTRTTYRYRSRTLTWNPKELVTTENVPLNYSLYDTNGKPLYYGIKVEANPDISNHYKAGLFGSQVLDYNYDTTYFYFSTDVIRAEISNAFLNSTATDEVTLFIQNTLESTTLTISTALALATEKFAENAVLSSISSACTYVSAILLPIYLTDIFLKHEKQIKLNEFIDQLKLLDNYKIYAVEFTRYMDNTSANFSLPQYYMETALVDSKCSGADNVSYVSMCINNNKKLNNGIDVVYDDWNLQYFGEVSYIKSFDEYEDYLSTYFSSYDVFNIFSWISI